MANHIGDDVFKYKRMLRNAKEEYSCKARQEQIKMLESIIKKLTQLEEQTIKYQLF